MMSKIQVQHRERQAYIYVRQSTMGQVRHHQESTERQYALEQRAQELGWSSGRTRVLDADLGKSGTQMEQREGFKTLMADVALGEVGAILVLEASRLARSGAAWQRLFEICALTDTLIVDEDGCYDLKDFNDRMLLDFKASMTQAELQVLRGRLHGGKLNKARKGELRCGLPVGFQYGQEGEVVLDPDLEVQGAIRLVFETFKEEGSACGVIRSFAERELKFPSRERGEAGQGDVSWGRLSRGRVFGVLKNPVYAGAYVYGRRRAVKEISPDGTIRSKQIQVPQEAWTVLIRDHHEGYITWDQHEANLAILEKNRPTPKEGMLGSAAREGWALLQGLMICGECGRRVGVRYAGRGGKYVRYVCRGLRPEGLASKECLWIRADILDEAISERALEVMEPFQIELAEGTLKQLEKREEAVHRQWKMRVQRAEYEARLAEKRHARVDPDNRLVAATLEARWEETLTRLEEAKQQYSRYLKEQSLTATEEQRARVLSLAQDLPALWHAPTTEPKDRKRMLGLIIQDITIEKTNGGTEAILHVRWKGGATEDICVAVPPPRPIYTPQIIQRVQDLAQALSDREIADLFNQEGLLSPRGKSFTPRMIAAIRSKPAVPSVNGGAV